MDTTDNDKPAAPPDTVPLVAVCNLVADVGQPALCSHVVNCSCCAKPVWLPCSTIAAVHKLGRRELCVMCTACFAPYAARTRSVLTCDEQAEGAGERAAAMGVAGDTPVINVDRVHRA